MCLWTDLLDEGDLPNKISLYNDIKIAFFTKKLKNTQEVKEMVKSLNEKGFYNIDSVYSNSNYPEWVFIKNNETGKQVIVKDMWYKPLDVIIEKYKDQLD